MKSAMLVEMVSLPCDKADVFASDQRKSQTLLGAHLLTIDCSYDVATLSKIIGFSARPMTNGDDDYSLGKLYCLVEIGERANHQTSSGTAFILQVSSSLTC